MLILGIGIGFGVAKYILTTSYHYTGTLSQDDEGRGIDIRVRRSGYFYALLEWDNSNTPLKMSLYRVSDNVAVSTPRGVLFADTLVKVEPGEYRLNIIHQTANSVSYKLSVYAP